LKAESTAAEVAADGPRAVRASAEAERRALRDHAQAGHAREPVQHFLGDAVGEVALIAVAGQVLERQHGDRGLAAP